MKKLSFILAMLFLIAILAICFTGCRSKAKEPDDTEYSSVIVLNKQTVVTPEQDSRGRGLYTMTVYQPISDHTMKFEIDSATYSSVTKGDTIQYLITHTNQ